MSNRPKKFKSKKDINPIRLVYDQWVQTLELFGVKNIPTFEEYNQIRTNDEKETTNKLCMILYKELLKNKSNDEF